MILCKIFSNPLDASEYALSNEEGMKRQNPILMKI